MLFSAITGTLQAQEQGKIRVGVDMGVAMPKGGAGFSYHIEPKYNIQDNMSVGLKVGGAFMAKELESADTKISANGSYIGTYDYYFHNSGKFAPYLGGGVGYFGLGNLEADVNTDLGSVSTDVEVDSEIGGMIRGGFEAGKFRLGVEYMLIPKSEVGDTEVSNSYLNIHFGFFIGGGRWGR